MIVGTKQKEDIGNVGKLIITKPLQKIIDYLHYKVGSTEWSGILFYKLIQGNIDTLKDLVFEATFLYPMNIGSSAYTEFDYNGEVVNAYDLFEEGIEQSTGLVHSHHNMTAFFSGTDDSELMDNASNYNYYLSLVVNFAHDYAAKLAVPVKSKAVIESSFKNTQGKIVSISRVKEEETILLGSLTVEIEGETTESKWLEDRVAKLKEVKVVTYPNYSGNYMKEFGDFYKLDRAFTPTHEEIPVVKVTAEKFLTCLIACNSMTVLTLNSALVSLKAKKKKELEMYEEALDSNVEIIHENLYGNMDDFQRHCLDALNVLHDKGAEFSDTEGFDILNQTLCSYVSL
jgi:hypothetical protein